MVSGYQELERESYSLVRSFGDSSMSGVGPIKGRPRLFSLKDSSVGGNLLFADFGTQSYVTLPGVVPPTHKITGIHDSEGNNTTASSGTHTRCFICEACNR